MIHRILAMMLAFAFGLFATPVVANQSNTWSPTTGTVSGLQLSNNYNNAFSAIQSCNSGNIPPTNDQTGASVKGQCFLDTSTTPNILKQYDGTSWVILGYLDTVNHRWIPVVGGGTATVASAGTTDLCATPESALTISGVTTITSFGSGCQVGQEKSLIFSGALTLTHAAGLFLPNNGSNITTVANDKARAVYLGSSNWIVTSYAKADGTSLNASSTFAGAVSFNGPITITLGGSTNNWNPTGLATANVIRLSCSSAINITGLVAPATDGKILVVDNVGSTNTCTITAEDANSTAANRFAFDRPIAVRPGRSVTVKYDLTAARWRLIQEITAQPVAGGFKNLRVFNAATAFGDSAPSTPNNQISVVAEEITVEDASGGASRLSSVSVTPDVTTVGVVNGLDTGSVTVSQWYSVWVIFNPTSNTIGGLFSVSATAPTLPSGYTFKVRVGWGRTDASGHFLRAVQSGRRAQYVGVFPQIASLGVVTASSQSVSNVVPPTTASLRFVAGYSAATLAAISANNGTSTSFSTNLSPFAVNSSGSGSLSGELMLESTNIFIWNSAGTTVVDAVGWEDNL